MLELELATTEQILDELSRRPLRFVFVSADGEGGRMQTGYLAHSPELAQGETLFLLRKAEEYLEDTMCGDPTEDAWLDSDDEDEAA